MGTPAPASQSPGHLPAASRDLHPREAPRRRAVGRASLTTVRAANPPGKRRSGEGRRNQGDDRATMQTFIRVTEIWLPNRDRSRLEFGDGLYGPLGDFRAVSERTSFAFDEGLPGKAWAARHPIILKDLQTSYFRRGEAAKEAGLTSAVALPVMAGDILLAVVVFLCGDDAEHVGAIELWHNDAAVNAEMGLVDGYYGTADAFGWLSRNTKFTRGSGLPGLAWKSGLPVVLHDLGRAHSFLRWEDGAKVG